jgi:hypothetical protein
LETCVDVQGTLVDRLVKRSLHHTIENCDRKLCLVLT